MKRILSSIIVLAFIAGAGSCFAYPAVQSLTDGLKEVAMSPLHVSDNVKTEMDSAKFKPFGIVGGAAKGTFYMGKQIVDGTWKIATIPYHMIKEKL